MDSSRRAVPATTSPNPVTHAPPPPYDASVDGSNDYQTLRVAPFLHANPALHCSPPQLAAALKPPAPTPLGSLREVETRLDRASLPELEAFARALAATCFKRAASARRAKDDSKYRLWKESATDAEGLLRRWKVEQERRVKLGQDIRVKAAGYVDTAELAATGAYPDGSAFDPSAFERPEPHPRAAQVRAAVEGFEARRQADLPVTLPRQAVTR